MNFYPRYPGDYARKTARLSLLEHGAYTLLLDECYSSEIGLPADLDDLCRLCRAIKPDERRAVQRVVELFFPLCDDGLRHNLRADQEIAKALPKLSAARQNGAKGGRKPKRKDPSGLSTGITKQEPTGFLDRGAMEPTGLPAGLPTGVPGGDTSPEPEPELRETEARVTAHARAPDAIVDGFEPTAAGRICRAMKRVGLQAVNPGDPRLLALIAQGATEAEFVGIAAEAVDKGKSFGWVLAVLQSRREEAAAIDLRPASPPPAATVPSNAADATRRYLAEQRLTPEERAKSLAAMRAIREIG